MFYSLISRRGASQRRAFSYPPSSRFGPGSVWDLRPAREISIFLAPVDGSLLLLLNANPFFRRKRLLWPVTGFATDEIEPEELRRLVSESLPNSSSSSSSSLRRFSDSRSGGVCGSGVITYEDGGEEDAGVDIGDPTSWLFSDLDEGGEEGRSEEDGLTVSRASSSSSG